MIFTHDMMKPVQLKVEKRSENKSLISSYSGGKVILQGRTEEALIFGKKQLELALKSGHVKEYLGECSPRFPVRPLWIKGKEILDQESYEQILEYGFNILMTDFKKMNLPDVKQSGLKSAVPVKVEVEDGCFFDESYQTEVQGRFSELAGVDYIYWEGTFHSSIAMAHPKGEDLLIEEIALFEVKLLESYLPNKVTLIYYLASEDASEWFVDFCDSVGSQTIIAFSSLANDPNQLHPFWEASRKVLDSSSTPLLPLMELGMNQQGGGLWPQLPFDTLSETLTLCSNDPFKGAISQINELPNRGALLDGILWVTGQMLWKEGSPRYFAETWFAAMRPELEYPKYRCELESISVICRELSHLDSLKIGTLSHDACREIAESIMSQLKRLRTSFSQKSKKGLSFLDYFTYFSRDASKLLLHFLQKQNIPITSLFNSDDLECSFWAEVGEGSKREVQLLEFPNVGAEGSVMNQIFNEVYGS